MNPSWVLDGSVALAWCFHDEATPATSELLREMRERGALVPSFWYVELTNVLALAERKGRIVPAKTEEFIDMIESFQLEVDDASAVRAFSDLLPLCRTHGITSYDAVYLDLALRRQLPLATLDEQLRGAAGGLGLTLLGL